MIQLLPTIGDVVILYVGKNRIKGRVVDTVDAVVLTGAEVIHGTVGEFSSTFDSTDFAQTLYVTTSSIDAWAEVDK